MLRLQEQIEEVAAEAVVLHDFVWIMKKVNLERTWSLLAQDCK